MEGPPHHISASFVTVDRDVRLEVLGWGGPSTGRTLVLVPGLGNTAHIFDVLATKLAARYHVSASRARGFGDFERARVRLWRRPAGR